MQGKTMPEIRLWVVAGLLLALFGSAQAGNEDHLKLMVTDCNDGVLDNALVCVAVHRGSQKVARATGYTDDGYVDFAFDNLLPGDEAAVTVTPAGGEPDGDHMYTYIWQEGQDNPNAWDLDEHAVCPDGWWNQGEQIIRCACDTAN